MKSRLQEPEGAPAPTGASFHDKLASTWDDAYKRGAFRRRAILIEGLLSRFSGVGQGWLDAGCGSGYFSRMLAGRGATVLGIDASVAMISAAENLARDVKLSGSAAFRVSRTIEKLDLPSASFDGVICLSVIEYVDNPEQAYREFARVLKPGGIALISVPHSGSPLRGALKLLRKLARRLRSGALGYLDLSLNEFDEAGTDLMLSAVGLVTQERHRFDPLVPKQLLTRVAGSLLFVVARKV